MPLENMWPNIILRKLIGNSGKRKEKLRKKRD